MIGDSRKNKADVVFNFVLFLNKTTGITHVHSRLLKRILDSSELQSFAFKGTQNAKGVWEVFNFLLLSDLLTCVPIICNFIGIVVFFSLVQLEIDKIQFKPFKKPVPFSRIVRSTCVVTS